jgi:type III restriction enzyme
VGISAAANDREQLTLAIVDSVNKCGRLDAAALQAVPVELKKTVEEVIPADVLQLTLDEFEKVGYLGKDNKPTQSMKEALKLGADALQLPERAEYARQGIFEHLSKQYATPQISNAENMATAVADKSVIFSDPFQQLWNKIKTKTRYTIELTDEMLRLNVATEVNNPNKWAYVNKVKIVYADADIDVRASGIYAEGGTESGLQPIETRHKLPDMLRYVSEQCNISKKLVFEIFESCDKMREFLNNPQVFMEQLVAVIRRVKARLEVANITYIPTGSSFDYMQVFDNFKEFSVNTKTNAVEVQHSVYNYIRYDSDKVELRFAERIDADNNILLFLKLPTKKFMISTPVGAYTPDWAIIKRNIHGRHQLIYFVVETKGSTEDEQQREMERVKIECAKKHFAALGYEIIENMPLDEKDAKYVVKTEYKDFALEG